MGKEFTELSLSAITSVAAAPRSTKGPTAFLRGERPLHACTSRSYSFVHAVDEQSMSRRAQPRWATSVVEPCHRPTFTSCKLGRLWVLGALHQGVRAVDEQASSIHSTSSPSPSYRRRRMIAPSNAPTITSCSHNTSSPSASPEEPRRPVRRPWSSPKRARASLGTRGAAPNLGVHAVDEQARPAKVGNVRGRALPPPHLH